MKKPRFWHLACIATMFGCGALTRQEARQALDELESASHAQALSSTVIEVSSDFTIGAAASDAAGEIRDFVQAQLPCAAVTVDQTQLVIEYGARDGSCTYRGQTLTGSHSISVSSNDADGVLVDHVWNAVANQNVELNGTATVTWSEQGQSRRVEHTARWTRLSDGLTFDGSGDRVQQPLDGGLLEGFSVEGHRSWQSARGRWDLEITDVSMRWVDAVPESGRYTLDTPFDKTLMATFKRQSPTAIGVEISGPKRSFDFEVRTPP